MRLTDYRVSRAMLTISALKYSTEFIKGKGIDGGMAQIYTIYRTRDLCQRNQFKPIRHEAISTLFPISIRAIAEAGKFIPLLADQRWPEEMKTIRTDLLKSKILDEEIQKIHDNPHMLKSLLNLYRRHFPAIVH